MSQGPNFQILKVVIIKQHNCTYFKLTFIDLYLLRILPIIQ